MLVKLCQLHQSNNFAEYMQADILALKSFVSQTSKKKSFNADKLFSR